MDLNLLLNEAIGGRSGRRGGVLERLMRSFLWSAVNQAMSTALETATAPVQTRTELQAAAAMETATAVPPPVTLPPAREAFEQVARPERRKSTWDREIERIQLEVTTELESMQPTLGRTPEQFEDVKPYILRTILDTLQEGRDKGMSATDLQRFITPSALISAADHGAVERQPRFAAYNLPSDIPERVRQNLTDVNFDRPQEGYRAVRDIPVPFGPQASAAQQPAAATQQTQPQGTSSQQRESTRQSLADLAMEEATRTTEQNTDATQELHGPLVALKRAIMSLLGFIRNTGATATGGGMQGGGNNNQPPAAPPPDDNQGDDRPNRRPSMFRRIMRRGPRRALTRAGAMIGGGVARLAGGNAMAGAAAGARMGAGFAAASGGPAGVVLIGLALITKKVIGVFKQLAAAAWDTTMRVGQWSGRISAATALLDVNRTIRDMQMAREIEAGGADYIREQDRFEKNMMPINTMTAQIGNWAGTTGLSILNHALERHINPMLDTVREIGESVAVGLDAIADIPNDIANMFRTAEEIKALEIEKKQAREKREAEDRMKELKERQEAIAPQMNNINAMMNDLAAGRRPF